MPSETLAAIAVLGCLVSVLCLLKAKNRELRRKIEGRASARPSRDGQG